MPRTFRRESRCSLDRRSSPSFSVDGIGRFTVVSSRDRRSFWGERRGLNPRPSVPQTDALPAELRSPQTTYTQSRPQSAFRKVGQPLLAVPAQSRQGVSGQPRVAVLQELLSQVNVPIWPHGAACKPGSIWCHIRSLAGYRYDFRPGRVAIAICIGHQVREIDRSERNFRVSGG